MMVQLIVIYKPDISCLNFWDEAWWFLSLRIFGLLSSSLLLFPQHFSRYVFRPSSGVCRTREPTWNFELRSSNFHVGSQVRQTPEEGWRIYWPRHCGNNNKDEDNSPKTFNDINQIIQEILLGLKELRHQAKSGRIQIIDSEVVLKAMKTNPVSSSQGASYKLDISQSDKSTQSCWNCALCYQNIVKLLTHPSNNNRDRIWYWEICNTYNA